MDYGTQLTLPAGAVIFRPEDECTGFVSVHSGVIRVSLNAASGRELVLYRVAPGQVCMQTFTCITQGRRYAAEAVAETPVEISIIPPNQFDRIMQDDPDFRARVYGAIAERFSDFEHTVQALAFSGLEARVAGILLKLAGNADQVTATHEQLAVEIGSAREAVGRQLGVFARQGLVGLARGQVTLLNRDGLSRLIGSGGESN